jgi:hypothetical protein
MASSLLVSLYVLLDLTIVLTRFHRALRWSSLLWRILLHNPFPLYRIVLACVNAEYPVT